MNRRFQLAWTSSGRGSLPASMPRVFDSESSIYRSPYEHDRLLPAPSVLTASAAKTMSVTRAAMIVACQALAIGRSAASPIARPQAFVLSRAMQDSAINFLS